MKTLLDGMTVGELIEELKKLPPECEVVFWNGGHCPVMKVDCDGVLAYLEESN